jgi:hypothetical protein
MKTRDKSLLERRLRAFLLQETLLRTELGDDIKIQVELKRFEILLLAQKVILVAKVKIEKWKQYEPTGDNISGEHGVEENEECNNVPFVMITLDKSMSVPVILESKMLIFEDEEFITRLKKCIEKGKVEVS